MDRTSESIHTTTCHTTAWPAAAGGQHDACTAAQETAASTTAAPIEALLLTWQATADDRHLASLVASVSRIVKHAAAATLHCRGIDDPAAVDDAVSLVLDHLRRLAQAQKTGERPVAAFAPRPSSVDAPERPDRGRAYVLWLARERAGDVARSLRRRVRRTAAFSELDPAASACLAESAEFHDEHSTPSLADLCARLHDAVPRLPPRERMVIELLLEGKSQAVIAHALDVCEGTVSRLRARAVATLRGLLME